MNDKIKEINCLQRSIEELERFVYSLNHGNQVSSYSTKGDIKMNEFSSLSLGVYIWTGSQNPQYKSTIENKSVINKLRDSMLVIVNQELEIMRLKLTQLIK